MMSKTSHIFQLRGCQAGGSTKCPIMNAVTEDDIEGREDPILFKMNCAALVDDDSEMESLCQPHDPMAHGIEVDLKPVAPGGEGGTLITSEDNEAKFTLFECNEEDKLLFIRTSKPTQEEIDL